MSKEAMKLALDELKHIKQWCLRSIGIGLVNENVLAELEEALASEQEQRSGSEQLGEPVARLKLIMEESAFEGCIGLSDALLNIDEFYTTPQQRKPLTFERVYELWLARFDTNEYDDVFMNFARAIEAAHGIKE
jgi:hypothetical protein